jgi:hypothetical protein
MARICKLSASGLSLVMLSSLALWPSMAHGQVGPHGTALQVPCSPAPGPKYRILAQNSLAVWCQNLDPGQLIVPDGPAKLELIGTNGDPVQPLPAAITVVQPTTVQPQPSILIVYWNPDNSTALQPNKTYRLTLTYLSGTIAAYRAATPELNQVRMPVIFNFSTAESVSITAVNATKEYTITSNLGFSIDGQTLATTAGPTFTADHQPLPVDWQPCLISTRPTSYEFQCEPFKPAPSTHPITLDQLQSTLLEWVGKVRVKVHTLPGTPLIPQQAPFHDIFGGVAKFDAKARISRPTAPATKDNATLWLNLNYTAGVRASPAWILDVKYAPLLKLYHGYSIGPTATANIGNGSIQGQSATDTIDLGGTAKHIILPESPVSMYVINFGGTYETDRHFDRSNVLGVADFQWFPLGIYNTQQRQQTVQWNKNLHDPDSNAAQNAALTDISPYRYIGYDLDFHGSIEAGGNVIEHQVKASKGGAIEILSTFPVFRAVPQVHFLLQIYRFSFDDLIAGRYLATTEKTIVQTPANTLYLKNEQGWKAANTLTGSFALDAQGNVGLTVKYTTGFSPPAYKRVNSVQAGVAIKY